MLATNKDSNHAATVKLDLTIMRETLQLVGLPLAGTMGTKMPPVFNR
jgi:hypothetical protein